MTTAHCRPDRRRWILVAAVVASLLLNACTSRTDAEREPTMDDSQAAYRIETHIKEAVAQLPAAARLTNPSKTDSLPCTWSDDGDDDRVIVEHDYEIEGLPPEEHPNYFETVKRYWEDRGYRQARLNQKGNRYWEMVYTDSQGFNLNLAANLVDGKLFIASQSPCIWPDGTPESEE